MLAPHFSKSILFTATRSLRGTHFAAWTTAVAPYPKRKESCFKHCLILEMQIKTSKLYRWLPEAHIAPFCLAIFLRRQPPFCLATRRQCFTLTRWDCHWVTHWVGQEVLAKRKGPGNEFENKRTADPSLRKHIQWINAHWWCCVILLLHLNNKNNVCKQ